MSEALDDLHCTLLVRPDMVHWKGHLGEGEWAHISACELIFDLCMYTVDDGFKCHTKFFLHYDILC